MPSKVGTQSERTKQVSCDNDVVEWMHDGMPAVEYVAGGMIVPYGPIVTSGVSESKSQVGSYL